MSLRFDRVPPPRARRLGLLALAACVSATPAAAQLPDPFLVPRGALRLGFEPAYTNYDRLFDTAGTEFPLGAFFTTDSLGTTLLPTLAPAEAAVRALAGDPGFRFQVGALRGRLDADIRRLPFSLGLGLTRWLTFVATVPLVTTRVNATVLVDSTDANAGWNLATEPGGRPEAVDSMLALLGELEAAAGQLESGIAMGDYGCPTSAQCDQARALVDRARALAGNLSGLTGIPGLVTGDGDGPAPPFAPLASSAAGQAIQASVAALDAELQAFGMAPFTGSVPLPTTRVGAGALDEVLTGGAFGYDAGPLTPPRTVKLSGLGDIEVGFRLGLAQRPGMRVVVGAIARLPTGKRDDPANFLDLATGDRQTDLHWSLDAAFEPGPRVGLWLGAAYTLQLPDRLTLRITPVDRPIALAGAAAVVDRNLGDVIRVSAHPALRLAPEFRVFVSALYERKLADRYTRDGTPLPELEALTEREAWAFGAGMLYRVEGRGRSGLPIEASLHYQAAFFGNGGAAPKTGRVALSLRLYYGLWGRGAPPPAPDPAAPAPAR